MTRLNYHLRSLLFHWKSHLWVALAVAVAAAVLTGALIVGDSMRGSLRELAVGRLGRVDFALTAPRFLQDDLAARFLKTQIPAEYFSGSRQVLTPADAQPKSAATIMMLRGAATHAESRARVGRVNLVGVDEHFWALDSYPHDAATTQPAPRTVILNEPLAAELNAKVGDDVILHLGKPAAISTETLLGRRDETTATLRLTVAAILPPRGLAAFDLNPRQGYPQNAYVPLATLQRAVEQPGKANFLLIESNEKSQAINHPVALLGALHRILAESMTPADLTLKTRNSPSGDGMIVESDSLLIEPPLEELVIAAAGEMQTPASRFMAYLANTIRKKQGSDDGQSAVIPYSTIVAVDPESDWMTTLRLTSGQPLPLGENGLLLNQWAADDLGAKPGDTVEISYYLTTGTGALETHTAAFTLQGIVPVSGIAADPDLVPQYKGVTDAKSLADWDPPFPVDLKLIRDKDEEYWKQHKTTPKAFISLADAERLWAQDAARFGRVTAIRMGDRLRAQVVPEATSRPAESFESAIRSQVNSIALGLEFQPVRAMLTASASGPTDFGMLFLSFSIFLIASAAMLVALLFRLGIEKRAFEIGLLLAQGFAPKTVSRMILFDGFFVSLLGTLIGLLAASGFAWLMLAGLRTWWSAAVNAPLLSLHFKPATLIAGAVISLFVAIATSAWSVRGLTRRAPRPLLAGAIGDDSVIGAVQSSRRLFFAAAADASCLVISIVLGANAESMTRALAFFGGGSAALVLCLILLLAWLRTPIARPITAPGPGAMVRMGMRSARRNQRRSLLTAGLIASASFLIVSLEAFRLDPNAATGRDSGTGGFALYAESAAPLPYDPATPDGRKSLGLDESAGPAAGPSMASFRLRPGDESSCLNLYRPTQPRILGASPAFITRGGFAFAESLAVAQSEMANPWTLLNGTLENGAIPAIADANAVRWQYHLGLGKNLMIKDERGNEVPLRFVALLNNSALQDEIIIADANFTRLFPTVSGRSFFLIESPSGAEPDLERRLESRLEPFGFDAATLQSRLRNYFAVQNTYISTFQTLGGLGLLLGAAGLAAVLVRNVWERRRELALMRTAGFTHASLALLVLSENLALVLAGLLCGVLSAALAIVPLIVSDAASLPLSRLSLILGSVLVAGLLSGLVAVSRTLRTPLIPALRSE